MFTRYSVQTLNELFYALQEAFDAHIPAILTECSEDMIDTVSCSCSQMRDGWVYELDMMTDEGGYLLDAYPEEAWIAALSRSSAKSFLFGNMQTVCDEQAISILAFLRDSSELGVPSVAAFSPNAGIFVDRILEEAEIPAFVLEISFE